MKNLLPANQLSFCQAYRDVHGLFLIFYFIFNGKKFRSKIKKKFRKLSTCFIFYYRQSPFILIIKILTCRINISGI